MSIIEQAAKRLEELSRAGVNMPWANGPAPARKESVPESAAASLVALHGDKVKAVTPPVREPAERSQQVELDLARLEKLGFLVPSMTRSRIASEFREIKHPMLTAARDTASNPSTRRNVIMVTSALQGEGKSFCAINLAMSIAMEVDSSVLLVDADVLRPTVLSQLGLQPARGLMDVLTTPNTRLASVMLKTNVPKLTLLPSGTKEEKSTELLGSAAMDRLLDDLATRYPDRMIVIDTPPLLLTTESRVLASRGGQILMVVEEGRTQQSEVARAFAAVESCPVVYAMLNKCRAVPGRAGYGYYGYA